MANTITIIGVFALRMVRALSQAIVFSSSRYELAKAYSMVNSSRQSGQLVVPSFSSFRQLGHFMNDVYGVYMAPVFLTPTVNGVLSSITTSLAHAQHVTRCLSNSHSALQ